MSNTVGNGLKLTLFGESHGKAVGAVLDGLGPGIRVDEEYIKNKMRLRAPGGEWGSKREESDSVEILSGVYKEMTTGTPIAFLIRNEDAKSEDYEETENLLRPGHADYTSFIRANGHNDPRGGGASSGRLTAPLVAAGALVEKALLSKGIRIGTHIKSLGGIEDRDFDSLRLDILDLTEKEFAVLDSRAEEQMKIAVKKAAEEEDSLGGVLETAAIGVPAGIGEPFFDSLESTIAHLLFSIPAVKGVEFGDGFKLAGSRGSLANDAFGLENGKIVTLTNHNGGINGGISNGMPVLVRTAVKPTPSIGKEQKTVSLKTGEETAISIKGRHDPACVIRARAAVDAAVAMAIADALISQYGAQSLSEE